MLSCCETITIFVIVIINKHLQFFFIPVVEKLYESTEEGKKVSRARGEKWCAVFRRIPGVNVINVLQPFFQKSYFVLSYEQN